MLHFRAWASFQSIHSWLTCCWTTTPLKKGENSGCRSPLLKWIVWVSLKLLTETMHQENKRICLEKRSSLFTTHLKLFLCHKVLHPANHLNCSTVVFSQPVGKKTGRWVGWQSISIQTRNTTGCSKYFTSAWMCKGQSCDSAWEHSTLYVHFPHLSRL